LSAFFYALGFSLTPEELGHKAATMNLQELYDAKDTILHYEELSDSGLAKWLPAERIVESRIDSLKKAPSRAEAPAAEENTEANAAAESNTSLVKNFGLYVQIGYSAGGDYLDIVKANSGLSSLSGAAGFLQLDFGAQFKTFDHFYLSPRFIFENSSINIDTYVNDSGVTQSAGTSESYYNLLLPGVDARYYLIENSTDGLYIGGSAGINLFLKGFSTLRATANNPQLGVFAGWQMRLFHRLFRWREKDATGIEIGYNYIPVAVSNLAQPHENIGGVFITISRYFFSSNYK
jgi:hypothetical protein